MANKSAGRNAWNKAWNVVVGWLEHGAPATWKSLDANIRSLSELTRK